MSATVLCATVLAATVAPAAAATAPAHVALLVKYPDATVRTWCVPWRAGMTGADVLVPASPTYGTGPYTGFVVRIGGTGRVPPTATRYWAYWRSPTGTSAGLTYSTSGVSSTRPAAGGVEEWVWTTSATTRVPHRSYATLCPGQ